MIKRKMRQILPVAVLALMSAVIASQFGGVGRSQERDRRHYRVIQIPQGSKGDIQEKLNDEYSQGWRLVG